MNFSEVEKQAQPIRKPLNKRVSFKSLDCQPLREDHGLDLTGSEKDVFVSSKKAQKNENISFSSKMKQAVKKIANNLGL